MSLPRVWGSGSGCGSPTRRRRRPCPDRAPTDTQGRRRRWVPGSGGAGCRAVGVVDSGDRFHRRWDRRDHSRTTTTVSARPSSTTPTVAEVNRPEFGQRLTQNQQHRTTPAHERARQNSRRYRGWTAGPPNAEVQTPARPLSVVPGKRCGSVPPGGFSGMRARSVVRG